MKQLVRIASMVFAAAMVLLAAFQVVRAEGKWPSNAALKPPAASKTNDPPGKTVPHILLTTYFTQKYYGWQIVDLPFETADENAALDKPITLTCPLSQGCTLEIEQSVGVGGVSSSGNWWGPFVQVDGDYLSYGPPVGETPTDESFILTTSHQSTPLTAGTHTVQSSVYSFYGLYISSYHITYRVYAP